MSNFYDYSENPATGNIEKAYWMDGYFGRHEYGVKFPDGRIFRGHEIKQPGEDTPQVKSVVVQIAELFDVPIRFGIELWYAMDTATKRQLIADIVHVGSKPDGVSNL